MHLIWLPFRGSVKTTLTTTTMSLAQELIDSILDEVNDFASLKTCSLVASSFRCRSQRILYRRVRLLDNYGPIRALLHDSPRIASYIEQLDIHLPSRGELYWTKEHLRMILETYKLANVRRCLLRDSGWASSHLILTEMSAALIEFLSRQSLSELILTSLYDIPVHLFLRFFAFAPKVQLCDIRIGSTEVMPIASHSGPQLLVVASKCDSVCDLFLRPRFLPYLASLRSLAITPDPNSDELQLISNVCSTLHHLHLFRPMGIPTLPFSFRQLRSVQFDFELHVLTWEWECISHFVAPTSCPRLQKIIFHATFWAQLSVDRELLDLLDAALATHPGRPCMTWIMHPVEFGTSVVGRLGSFSDWVSAVHGWMPKTLADDRLVVEVDGDVTRVA
ncbi:hypothetical protein FB45DRAFT_329362 [Roridomyces roridus]|uniref:Uncharacterized protein n=1 Tax=Roridomyces roridus TaxID=1738132 RepID=A0AAD7FBV8_9AGAR|nr:hypothetical protein FB45DRAFT_329362 [Roridomyces roridus]